MSKYIDIINEGTVHNLKMIYEQNYVRHGRWDDSKVAFHRVCSECGAVVRQDVSLVYLLECMEQVGALNYCPNCGSRMDLDGDTE